MERNLEPMLIRDESAPFDDPDYIFELKFDGSRVLAYLDGEGTLLQNKRKLNLSPLFPELRDLHRQISADCILDGELVCLVDGVPSFATLQRRCLLSHPFRIKLAAEQTPASLFAYDILSLNGNSTAALPLMERKRLLRETVTENKYLSISKYVEGEGKALYEIAKAHNLEGIVAKKKNSPYRFGARTKDWVKIKYQQDEDFVICGYVLPTEGAFTLVLGQYSRDGKLLYQGHVTGVSREVSQKILTQPTLPDSPIDQVPRTEKHRSAVWIAPALVCTVRYMHRTPNGAMRQPAFKGLREDKRPEDCRIRD